MGLSINRNHAQLDEKGWNPWARKVLAESLLLIEKDEQQLSSQERTLRRAIEPCLPQAQVARLSNGQFLSIKKASAELLHIGGKISMLREQKRNVQRDLQSLKMAR